MVTNNDLIEAANVIDDALRRRFSGASEKVFVYDTEWGYLRAIIGSDGFKQVPIVERQTSVWDFLRQQVPEKHLHHLIEVNPMDLAEYDASVSES